MVGTVPYREDLELSVAVCPQCGNRFHRWGHRKAFDIADLRAELCAVFPKAWVRARRTAFPDWNRGPWGRFKAFSRVALAILGMALAQPNILFMARRMPSGEAH